jgi:hypothetical protein
MLPLARHALLVALWRVMPLPFVDDWMHRRAMRQVVRHVLERRGRRFDAEDVRPLYDAPLGLLRRVSSIGKGLLIKPMRKLGRSVLVALAVRRAALEAGEVLLLGHTLDRFLASGWMTDEMSPAERRQHALRIGRAVEKAWGRTNQSAFLDLVRGSLSSLLRRSGPPVDAAPAAPVTSGKLDELESQLPPEQVGRLRAASRQLARKLSQPPGQTWLARFDAEVDRCLGRP